jgi:hypothetical protein
MALCKNDATFCENNKDAIGSVIDGVNKLGPITIARFYGELAYNISNNRHFDIGWYYVVT